MTDLILSSTHIDRLNRLDEEMALLVHHLNQAGFEELFGEAQMFLDLRTQLSPGAFLMLMIPLLEVARFQHQYTEVWGGSPPLNLSVDTRTAKQSVLTLLRAVEQSPAATDAQLQKRTRPNDHSIWSYRSSLSVIKAFWKHFCNIPPFCGEK